ncbi:BirA family transcriptional regulator, biotin operon repressor / biotin-[acetyl-CoA-carboxylase] ligase [Steroidobacter denitrificans]|uniref:Bifunctional ligase/repressor BirA n=1 Tax=Steroidobacter denitrificans TaxID=465721 RepID=A0A127F984_STEDE|nr:biotin--[acetyl-CoA-carboxylase] ligase [Steroidobacter denitrificans]AMN46155.1 BirA family transcriptional regulator, biotin operon repressor / biotin-[acetyl-CoA-carboxylase] ligase [Steroidobacter denitrificans]
MAATAKFRTEIRRKRLLAMLSDGEFHSGEQLAKRLRISRSGIWKLMRSLRALGIELESVPRQGYRLPAEVNLLDREIIEQALMPQTRAQMEHLEVLLQVDSTNRHLADQAPAAAGRMRVCTAELQTAGRGRRGRSWLAPFGSGICLSMGWQFVEVPPGFSALGLAVGVAAVRAFRRLGIEGVGLKWPNDLVWRHRKLGGILIEMRGESTGPAYVVIGIGLNMRMPASTRLGLAEQQAMLVCDLHEIAPERTPSRNQLIAALIDESFVMLDAFAMQGFSAFAPAWGQFDTLAGAPVKVLSGAQTIAGIARGVDSDGGLLVEVDGELRRFISGEVSLRAAD